jgi:hypothetical protein
MWRDLRQGRSGESCDVSFDYGAFGLAFGALKADSQIYALTGILGTICGIK